MKNLINDVKVKFALKSLLVNGSLKNLHLKVKGNVLIIGEVVFVDNNKGNKANLSFNKDSGGNLEVSGNHDYKLVINNLSINGDGGEELSFESLELNSVAEGMELFASILK